MLRDTGAAARSAAITHGTAHSHGRRSSMRQLLGSLALLAAAITSLGAQPANDRLIVAERVDRLTRESRWRPVASIPIAFTTHHPQGMVKIGSALFVSAVEVQVRTKPFPQPVDGFDRDAGQGVGHLFKIDLQGNLITDLKLGDGTIYHPGRHRLRRQVHLGPGGRIPAQQPLDRLPRRPRNHEGHRSVPISRPPRRRRPRYRRQHVARGQLGIPPLLSMGDGSRLESHERRYAARKPANAQHVALSRLPGLQVRGAASHAVHRRHRDAPVSRSRHHFDLADSSS